MVIIQIVVGVEFVLIWDDKVEGENGNGFDRFMGCCFVIIRAEFYQLQLTAARTNYPQEGSNSALERFDFVSNLSFQ